MFVLFSQYIYKVFIKKWQRPKQAPEDASSGNCFAILINFEKSKPFLKINILTL